MVVDGEAGVEKFESSQMGKDSTARRPGNKNIMMMIPSTIILLSLTAFAKTRVLPSHLRLSSSSGPD